MRPKIICHMMSSIDGRLLADRWTPPAHGVDLATLRGHYDGTASRLAAEGWIVGRTTMEMFGRLVARADSGLAREPRLPHVGRRGDRDVAVAIDPRGKLHYMQDQVGGDHVVAVLGEQVPDTYLAALREVGVSYLFAGPSGDDLGSAMDRLGDTFGIKTILLEGGGITNGAFLRQGLIDEISLLVYPGIDGLAGIPSIFEHVCGDVDRPGAGRSLRFAAAEILEGGMVWLRYGIEASGSPL
ncbi:dihydrofolate reductase family protein [Rhodoplanes sp. SY1]|uniref:dihydrofolate reductase family protein n=1 Tax=Rhodoplanes sp. SY1 TaxID=3166646 RepID=UPI0038B5D1D1